MGGTGERTTAEKPSKEVIRGGVMGKASGGGGPLRGGGTALRIDEWAW